MLQPLKKRHLARLSPVMHAYGRSFIRPELEVPITAMGNYEKVDKGTPVNPRGEALWSNTYRIGAAGSLSRVTPFGPAAFSGLGTNGNGTPSLGERISNISPLLIAMGLTVGALYLMNR
jgi:hypothetical protein